MKHWHLVMTKPRDDDKAEQHLLNQGHEIFRPQIRRHKISKGRQITVLEPLFPRYIFIQLDDVIGQWSAIRSTRGVAGMVRFSDLPAKVPQALIDGLKSRVDIDNILDITCDEIFFYKAGDRVQITAGSFKGLEAIVKTQESEQRVILLFELLGKFHSLDMPLENVVLV